jgi:DNA repair exonuclease SbcCD ATPase subunit
MVSPIEWLEGLPIYNCPLCSEKTIFKESCFDCDTKMSQEYDMANLPEEIEKIEKEIARLQYKLKARTEELSDITKEYNKRNKNDSK